MRIIGNDQKNNGQIFWEILERIIGKISNIIGAGLLLGIIGSIIGAGLLLGISFMHVHFQFKEM